MRTIILLFFFIITVPLQVSAQKVLVIIDKAGFMNPEIEKLTGERLAGESVTLATMIDTRDRCSYIYANLFMSGTDLQLKLNDCNDLSPGTKNLGSKILSANDSEKALLLYFALSDLMKKTFTAVSEKAVGDQSVAQPQAEISAPATVNPGHHRSRYFFAPSSYNLKKGEIYYNTVYFLVHDVQFGLSDQFSMGMGTTIIGFPFYLTPKVTIPVNAKSSFAIGDMLMVGTYGANFTGNLLYSTFTTGGDYNNITFGASYLHVGGGDISDPSNAMVLNVSALARISDHIYFITENYASDFKVRRTAEAYDYNSGTYQSSDYRQNVFFIYGLAGFRFINRSKDIKSWQFGMSYAFTSRGQIPSMYRYSNWYVEYREGSKIIVIPVIGFTKKFSTRE
jgi:hypothetical protein